MSAPHAQILIVEDEPAIADALQFVLRSEGFAPRHAATLGAARACLRQAPVDLVVLDIGLPDGSGFDFCKELRQTSRVPVLFLTARHEEIDRILGLELGADDYVTKPFSPREVAARIKAILRRITPEIPAVAEPAPSVVAGNIVADLTCACARVNGLKVDLTRNELLLLHFLQTHPGQVFSRRQLMDAVWEVPEAATERTVDAHIKTLRRKIPSAPIETHRGFGYSWQVENEE
jgi:two-component system, OmpR family, catabolic regulation response regulator CreB